MNPPHETTPQPPNNHNETQPPTRIAYPGLLESARNNSYALTTGTETNERQCGYAEGEFRCLGWRDHGGLHLMSGPLPIPVVVPESEPQVVPVQQVVREGRRLVLGGTVHDPVVSGLVAEGSSPALRGDEGWVDTPQVVEAYREALQDDRATTYASVGMSQQVVRLESGAWKLTLDGEVTLIDPDRSIAKRLDIWRESNESTGELARILREFREGKWDGTTDVRGPYPASAIPENMRQYARPVGDLGWLIVEPNTASVEERLLDDPPSTVSIPNADGKQETHQVTGVSGIGPSPDPYRRPSTATPMRSDQSAEAAEAHIHDMKRNPDRQMPPADVFKPAVSFPLHALPEDMRDQLEGIEPGEVRDVRMPGLGGDWPDEPPAFEVDPSWSLADLPPMPEPTAPTWEPTRAQVEDAFGVGTEPTAMDLAMLGRLIESVVTHNRAQRGESSTPDGVNESTVSPDSAAETSDAPDPVESDHATRDGIVAEFQRGLVSSREVQQRLKFTELDQAIRLVQSACAYAVEHGFKS